MNQYKHELMGALFGLALLNIWYFSSIAIEEEVLPKHYEYFYNVIIVIFSTALGAYLAFRYNASLERQKIEVQIAKSETVEISKLNRALFNLVRQLNSIDNMNLLLSQYKNKYELAFKMSVNKNFDSTPIVDFDELTFILPEELSMLLILDNEQAGFFTTLESFQLRSDFFINRLIPEMTSKGFFDGEVVIIKELREKLSYGTYSGALHLADVLQANVESSLTGLESSFKDLRIACKKKYPEAKFINLE